jgi:hypothetical protein
MYTRDSFPFLKSLLRRNRIEEAIRSRNWELLSSHFLVPSTQLCPDIALVGHFEGIPKRLLEDLYKSGKISWRELQGVKTIARTANGRLPQDGAGSREWDRFMRSRDYRFLIRMQDLRIGAASASSSVPVGGKITIIPGFTPTPWIRYPRWDCESTIDDEHRHFAACDEIVAWTHMRIGWAGRLMAKAITGISPSSSAIEVKLRIDPEHGNSIRVVASSVPSLTLYVGGKVVAHSSCYADGAKGLLEFMRLDDELGPMSLRIEHKL